MKYRVFLFFARNRNINKKMTERIIISATILLELVSYYYVYRIIFGTKFKNGITIYIGSAVAIVLSTILLFDFLSIDFNVTLFEILLGIIIPVAYTQNKRKQWLSLYLVVVLFVSVVDTMIGYGLHLFDNLQKIRFLGTTYNNFILKIITVTAMGIFLFIKSRLSADIKEAHLTRLQIVLYNAMTISFCAIVSINQHYIKDIYADNTKQLNIYMIASMVLYGSFAVFATYQGIIISRTREQEKRLALYEEFSNIQKTYIENLIYQDNEIRKFRHDLKNHLVTIEELCRLTGNNELQQYCGSLVKRGSNLVLEKYTGNSAVDAILSHERAIAISKKIHTNYTINLTDIAVIDAFDLCVILMNILQNAIEANLHISEDSRYVDLNMSAMSDSITIIVSNPSYASPVLVNKSFRTSKSDDLNHGLGLQNVADAVKRHDGVLDYSFKNGVFEIAISFMKSVI